MRRRRGFVLFHESRPLVEQLTLDQRGTLLTAVFAYDAGDPLPEMDAVTRIVFLDIKGRLDKAASAYEAVCEKRRDAANKRWADAKACKSMQEDANASFALHSTIREEEIEKEIITKENSPTESKRKVFRRPTVDEVRDYVNEKGYRIDPEAFVNFYESKGWVVGKSPMKDWKAAVRTWVQKQKPMASVTMAKTNKYGEVDYSKLLYKV